MISKPGQVHPKGFNKSRLILAGLACLAVSLACSFSIPFSTSRAPIPTPEAPLGLIAYVGNDGNIYTTDRDGKQPSAITQDAALNTGAGPTGLIYQYPTWAPDGQRLAFISIQASAFGPEANLYSALSDGKRRVQAFSSKTLLPFYLSWSPNSQNITFLGSDSTGELDQYLVAASGGKSKFISNGQPYYWDWSPDNQTILVHIGGSSSENPDARLILMGVEGSVTKKELDLKPAAFLAPAWSPAGDVLAVAAQTDTGDEQLILAGQDGKIRQVLARLNGPVDFAWSPKGVYLAYAAAIQAASGPAIRLDVVDSTHPDSEKQIAVGNILAFFWSPDGQKIAYFIQKSGPTGAAVRPIAQTNPGSGLVVQVYDRASGKTKEVAAFTPTDSFQHILPFYSQYQRSGTIWSPDNQSLVLAGVDPAGGNAIYTVGADGSQFHKIADGDLAFWSWK